MRYRLDRRLAALTTVTLLFGQASPLFVISSASAQDSDSERLERLERAVELLQKRNAELEREVAELKNQQGRGPAATARRSEPPTEAKTIVETTATPKKKKPVFIVPGASELNLTLGGFVQPQYEVGDVSAFEGRLTEGASNNRFRLRRARIYVSGDYAEQFEFKLEGEFGSTDTGVTVRDANGRLLASTSTRTSFGATDIYLNWHRFPEFNIKIGQYKAPFGLEQLTSDTKLFTIERSLVTSALTPEGQIGVQLWGRPFANIWPEEKELVTYYGGIFNGNGRNISVNDNNEYMYVGRVEVEALTAKGFKQDVSLTLGIDALTSRDDAGTNLSPVGNLLVNSDGSLSPFIAPTAAERDAYGVDAWLHLGCFDLVAEYLSERIHPRTSAGAMPAFSGFRAAGYQVQASYFLLPKTLQLVAKFENFNPGQMPDDDIKSLTGGLNYYIKGDDIKVLANYIHTWSEFRDQHPALGRSEIDEGIIRLQLMF